MPITGTPSPGDDVLVGTDDPDVIESLGGNDKIFGGAGDDVLDGGDGNDSVVADAGQVDILDGFETIDRTPNVTPPPVDSRTQPVAIMGGVVKVKNATASIKLTCPAGTSGSCTGSLALRTAEPVKLAGVKAVLQLGNARYTIAPGAAKTAPRSSSGTASVPPARDSGSTSRAAYPALAKLRAASFRSAVTPSLPGQTTMPARGFPEAGRAR